jgi:uncharacterized surface protein with fasciclin (FAS1) repeats
MTRNHKSLPLLFSLALAFLLLGGALFGISSVEAQETEANMVDTLTASDDFTMLTTALAAAGLDETLAGEGPFTLFAPTDAAFADLPTTTLESLLADPSGALTTILLHHVISGAMATIDLSDEMTATTLAGDSLTFAVRGDAVEVNGANVITADLPASNGVIHAIDAVLVPAAVDLEALTTVTPTTSLTATETVTSTAEITASTDLTATEAVTATPELTASEEITTITELTASEELTTPAELTGAETITTGEAITPTGELTATGEMTAGETTTATGAAVAAEGDAHAAGAGGEAAPRAGLPWWVWLFPVVLLFWLGWWWLNHPPAPPTPPAH